MDSTPTEADRIFTHSSAVMMHDMMRIIKMITRPMAKLLSDMHTSS